MENDPFPPLPFSSKYDILLAVSLVEASSQSSSLFRISILAGTLLRMFGYKAWGRTGLPLFKGGSRAAASAT